MLFSKRKELADKAIGYCEKNNMPLSPFNIITALQAIEDSPTDAEIEARLQSVKYPNGPEDKAIAEYGFDWDTLKDFANRDDWPLASKLAACLVKVGGIAEHYVERATYWKLMCEKKERV